LQTLRQHCFESKAAHNNDTIQLVLFVLCTKNYFTNRLISEELFQKWKGWTFFWREGANCITTTHTLQNLS